MMYAVPPGVQPWYENPSSCTNVFLLKQVISPSLSVPFPHTHRSSPQKLHHSFPYSNHLHRISDSDSLSTYSDLVPNPHFHHPSISTQHHLTPKVYIITQPD